MIDDVDEAAVLARHQRHRLGADADAAGDGVPAGVEDEDFVGRLTGDVDLLVVGRDGQRARAHRGIEALRGGVHRRRRAERDLGQQLARRGIDHRDRVGLLVHDPQRAIVAGQGDGGRHRRRARLARAIVTASAQ